MKSSEQARAYLVLTLVGFLETVAFSVVRPVFPLYVESFGVSYKEVGLVFSAYSFTWAALQVCTGYLADRFGRKRIALIGFAFYAGFALLNYTASSFPQLFLFRILQGVGWDSWAPLFWA